MRGLRKYPLLGTVLTFAIVAVLVVSGPALAMTVGLEVEDVKKGEVADITATAYVQPNERLPFTRTGVLIRGPDGFELACGWFIGQEDQVMSINGDCDCSHITVETTFSPAAGSRTLGPRYAWDDGVGYDFGFGYGYGYGYRERGGTYPVQVISNIDWLTDDDLASGTYEAQAVMLSEAPPYDTVIWWTPTETFSVTSRKKTVGGGGTGATYTPPTTQIFDEAGNMIAEGQFSLEGAGVGDTFTFESEGESHSGEIVSIGPDSIVIRFESEPQDVELAIGETKQIDLDYDGIYDIEVTLDGITNGEADVTVVDLDFEAPVGAEEPDVGTPAEPPDVTDLGEVVSGDNTLITAIVVILIVIVALGFVAKAPKKRK